MLPLPAGNRDCLIRKKRPILSPEYFCFGETGPVSSRSGTKLQEVTDGRYIAICEPSAWRLIHMYVYLRIYLAALSDEKNDCLSRPS